MDEENKISPEDKNKAAGKLMEQFILADYFDTSNLKKELEEALKKLQNEQHRVDD